MKKQNEKKLKPVGQKKTGNLKSIFKDNTGIYIKKNENLILLTEKKHNNLFWFMYNNWDLIMIKYFEVNKGQKSFKHTVNFYIPDAEFDKLKIGIPNIKNTIFLTLPENQDLMKIMNKTKLKLDQTNKTENSRIIKGNFEK